MLRVKSLDDLQAKAPRKRRNTPEDQLQAAFVQWFKNVHRDKIIHHSPNGGFRNEREGAKFKRLGVLAGWPDLTIPYGRKSYHGLLIEFKANDGKLTTHQERVQKVLSENGYCVWTCWTMEEAINVVGWYFDNKWNGERQNLFPGPFSFRGKSDALKWALSL